MGKKLSAADIKSLKGVRRLSFLTCYDYQTALWINRTGLDGVLVGDSLAQVLYGLESTSLINMETMAAHTKAVRKGITSIHLMADMPYVPGSQEGEDSSREAEEELFQRALIFKDLGADSVKLENPSPRIVRKIIEAGLPVCGHIGLTPQTIHDFKKQGKDQESAQRIFDQSIQLDRSGCFAMVLEAIPEELAERITRAVSAVTIGIASGEVSDAQILVHYDLMGLTYHPKKFVHPQAAWGEDLLQAVEHYIQSVSSPRSFNSTESANSTNKSQ